MSQLHKQQEESKFQPNPELAGQGEKVITLEQHLLIWFKNMDATPNYAKTNNLHVMWSESVIDTCDGCDFINVVFQSRHLNMIIIGLKLFSPFKYLH
jgi:hypothetical protein